eukprot:gb/GEZN01000588.1/.p1 GENE.gb/GEZN01000588.1/~~gb/GEZN01000588.1/.p1  ORF type:complete len:1220 (+),score=191.62 gb/GEZN01000588.1/:86-3661(+)
MLYYCVQFTTFGFQILLLLLCLMYYALASGILGGEWIFQDQEQALRVFEWFWYATAVWWLFLKWPASVYSLFLRRCPLSEAEYVAVFTQEKEGVLLSKSSDSSVLVLSKRLMLGLQRALDRICGCLFSDTSSPPGRSGNVEFCRVDVAHHSDGQLRREFFFHLCLFVYDQKTKVFAPGQVSLGRTLQDLLHGSKGLNAEQVLDRRALVGLNEIRVRKPKFSTSLLEEFSKVFYVYQNLMTWTWFNFAYWHMGIIYTMVYVLGGVSVAYVNYINELQLSTLSAVEGRALVLRDGRFVEVMQKEVVPGDVLVLSPGPAQCDMVLLSSQAVVDESSLTGESRPVVKVPLDDNTLAMSQRYQPEQHKKITIFAGTRLLQVSEAHGGEGKCLAIVTRTGAHTSKGELLRSILFSIQPRFNFDIEINLVIAILLFYAFCGFGITLKFLDTDPTSGWFYAMYVVGTCLPPLLPTVFVVSVGISANRLLKKGVVCSDPKRILMAGKVRVAAFDKTGTLTKQGLDFLGAVVLQNGRFPQKPAELVPRDASSPPIAMESGSIARAMAVCHTLSKVPQHTMQGGEQRGRGEEYVYVGNSVDVQMFEASGFELFMGKGKTQDYVTFNGGSAAWHVPAVRLDILKRFDFDHHRMTQSCVARDDSRGGPDVGNVWIYAKGSAEAIKACCDIKSLPPDYDQVADRYSRQGIYLLAMACRQMSGDEAKFLSSGGHFERSKVESKLTLLGFILFKNALKPDTAEALRKLREGEVRTLIVSGDHVLTAIHVGKDCGVIPEGRTVLSGRIQAATDGKESGEEVEWVDEQDQVVKLSNPLEMEHGAVELAVTGKVFNALQRSGQISELLNCIRIYGRMTPNDKIRVLQLYVDAGWITLMCGDGGNDCGALRTAHVGVALSDAEASVVSPFTALDKSCGSVVEVLLEGRCALSAAFSSYKYLLMYGQVETMNQIINAWLFITFTEWCWVWMDGVWVVCLAFTLPLAKPARTLAMSRPTSSVLGAYTLVSFLGMFFLNMSFLFFSLGVLFKQDWYQCRQWESTDISEASSIGDNYESSTIFLISGWQYVASAMAFNFGGLHRAGWFNNYRFVALVIFFSCMHFYITMVPSHLSCLFRINCDNENVVPFVTTMGKVPIQNHWNTTVIPVSFRWTLVFIMIANTVVIMAWEKVVIYGSVGNWVRRNYPRKRFLRL